ncbi:MAG: hypothetical protein ACRD04_12790 [Terriglobales bacterium]
MAEQRQLLQRVLPVLSHGGVSFAVAGAFAFQHYTGIWRFTKDLDIFLPAARGVPQYLGESAEVRGGRRRVGPGQLGRSFAAPATGAGNRTGRVKP